MMLDSYGDIVVVGSSSGKLYVVEYDTATG
jgi:hypothetical protein